MGELGKDFSWWFCLGSLGLMILSSLKNWLITFKIKDVEYPLHCNKEN